MAKVTKQITVQAEVEEEHVPEWKRFRARATQRGFANNQLYEQGDELVVILDAATKTKASWLEVLDAGTPVDGPDSLQNASHFARAEAPKVTAGFAAGQPLVM
jgi:hypothetical protein